MLIRARQRVANNSDPCADWTYNQGRICLRCTRAGDCSARRHERKVHLPMTSTIVAVRVVK